MSEGIWVDGVVIGLGGNLGDVAATFRTALAALEEDPGIHVDDVSHLYRTAPVGGPEQPDYLNAAVLVACALGPHGLLELLQALEAAAGRERLERWGPRTLDLDLLVYGEVVVGTPMLTVPHPRLAERRFALLPLVDVWPDARLPDGRGVRDLLEAAPQQGVERLVDGAWDTIK